MRRARRPDDGRERDVYQCRDGGLLQWNHNDDASAACRSAGPTASTTSAQCAVFSAESIFPDAACFALASSIAASAPNSNRRAATAAGERRSAPRAPRIPATAGRGAGGALSPGRERNRRAPREGGSVRSDRPHEARAMGVPAECLLETDVERAEARDKGLEAGKLISAPLLPFPAGFFPLQKPVF